MKTKATILAAALIAALATPAQALTVSSSFSNGLETTDISQTGSLALFDTSLGTLTGAVLTINGAFASTLTLTNESTITATVTGRSFMDLDFTSTLAPVDGYLGANPDLGLIFTTGPQTIASGGSFAASLTTAESGRSQSYDLGAILASLGAAGGGSFDIGCTSAVSTGVSGAGGVVSSRQRTQAMCGASISYSYEALPVPEAPTPMLMLAGLMALTGLVRLRRRPR